MKNSFSPETEHTAKDFGALVFTEVQNMERQKLAAWMSRNGFSTGHGDTIEELLGELEWQVRELRGKLSELMQKYVQL